MKKTLSLMLVLGLALGLAACSKNKKADANADLNAAAATTTYDDIVVEEDKMVEAVESIEVNLTPVYFALNEYSLSKEARNILSANAEILKIKGIKHITVEGNCDDRGTIAYNIALGQKRANEVRDYYIRLGLNSENINTISYGEENPVCTAQTNSCWAKNRRADTVVSAK
ncbi:MAG: OmpA family protein [Elusimicrobiaceae bacterium]|nr:OmpA family protein [Elusimicrobiaceae bacterium]